MLYPKLTLVLFLSALLFQSHSIQEQTSSHSTLLSERPIGSLPFTCEYWASMKKRDTFGVLLYLFQSPDKPAICTEEFVDELVSLGREKAHIELTFFPEGSQALDVDDQPEYCYLYFETTLPCFFTHAVQQLRPELTAENCRNILLLVAIFIPHLYERYQVLTQLFKNEPSKLQTISELGPASTRFAEVVRNCEDVALDDEDGFAILSCDPGRDKWNTVLGMFISPNTSGSLYLYDYALELNGHDQISDILRPLRLNLPAEYQDFHPLGIEYHRPSKKLYVVNHASSGSAIEVFSIPDPKSGQLTHVRSISGPLLKSPNSIAAISDHEIYVTNDHFITTRQSLLLSRIESYGGIPGGRVTYLNLATGEQKHVARLPFANGIALLNASTLAVASLSKPGIYAYEIDESTKNLHPKRFVKAAFAVDNLSVDGRGRLLVAGHPHPPSVETVARTNHRFHFENYVPDGSETTDKNRRPRAPSWVAEWDGASEHLTDVYISNEYGTSTTAVRDVKRKVVIVAGLYERGILVAAAEK